MLSHLSGNGGVSSAYVVPQARILENEESLAGNYLLLVLRGARGDVAFSSLFVRKVEQFEDGLNKGDILLTVDPSKSFRFVRTYDSGSAILASEKTNALSLGVHQIPDEMFDGIIEEVRKSIVVKLQFPPANMLASVTEQGASIVNDVTVKKMIGAFTSRFSLEEVWSSGVPPKLPPFGNFSYHKIKNILEKSIADDASTLLKALDPTVVVEKEVGLNAQRKSNANKLEPVIDLNLQPIDPEHVYARKFVAGARTVMDLTDSLEKTEHAEKRHQDMLRDIVLQLKKMGHSPMQSSSIDLFVGTDNQCVTFELKTSTPLNILSQSAKGIFQLGCYNMALSELGYSQNKLVLVLEKTSEPQLDDYVSQVLSFFGIVSLFYDITKAWPSRLNNLENCLT